MLDLNKLKKEFDALLASYSSVDLVQFAEEENQKLLAEIFFTQMACALSDSEITNRQCSEIKYLEKDQIDWSFSDDCRDSYYLAA